LDSNQRPPETPFSGARPLPAADFHKCKPSGGLRIPLITDFTPIPAENQRFVHIFQAFPCPSLPPPWPAPGCSAGHLQRDVLDELHRADPKRAAAPFGSPSTQPVSGPKQANDQKDRPNTPFRALRFDPIISAPL